VSLKKIREVEEAYGVYGVYDIVVKIKAESMGILKKIVTKRLRKLNRIMAINTLIVIGR